MLEPTPERQPPGLLAQVRDSKARVLSLLTPSLNNNENNQVDALGIIFSFARHDRI
jgi:hypothetical protein